MPHRRGQLHRRPQRGAQTLRIEIRGHFARVAPGMEDLLRAVLECWMPNFSLGGSQGWQRRDEDVRLYSMDKEGRLVTHAGLMPRVLDQLERRGYRVTVLDRTTWSGLEKAVSSLPAEALLDAHSRRFLAAMRRNPKGEIRTRSEDSAAWCVGLLGQLHPRANIAIACVNRTRAKRLQRRLESLSDRKVQLGPKIDWRHGRMMVCTADTFAHCTPDDWDVVVCTDIQSALAKQSMETLAAMKWQLRYCLLPAGQRIGPRSGLLLEAFFGDEIFREPDPRGTPGIVRVLFAESPGQACRRGKNIRGLEWKRKCIWRDDARNRTIAEIAMALRTGDVKALARRGLQVPAEVDQASGRMEGWRTVILVESTEHAAHLLRYLPGWSPAHDVPRDKAREGLSKDDWAIPVGDKTMVTFVHAERCGIAADALIRADGYQQWPLSPESFPSLGSFQGDEVLLIDLVDRVAGAATRQPRSRRNQYQEMGWRVEGAYSGRPRCEKTCPAY